MEETMEEQEVTQKETVTVEEEAVVKETIDQIQQDLEEISSSSSSSSAGESGQSGVAVETGEGGGGGGGDEGETTPIPSVSTGGTVGGGEEGGGTSEGGPGEEMGGGRSVRLMKTARKRTKEEYERYRLFQDEMKFMKDFDPNERIVRKKMRSSADSRVIIPNRCDCLIDACPGCHFYPCAGCGGHFCGHVCRRGRRWEFEELEIQGGPSTLEKRTLPTYKDAVADE